MEKIYQINKVCMVELDVFQWISMYKILLKVKGLSQPRRKEKLA
jgi:hypothetical protein